MNVIRNHKWIGLLLAGAWLSETITCQVPRFIQVVDYGGPDTIVVEEVHDGWWWDDCCDWWGGNHHFGFDFEIDD